MGWTMGLEPTTTGITIRYSNQLSYAHRNHEAGAPDRNRTCNRRLRRPMLYPVELRALDFSLAHDPHRKPLNAASNAWRPVGRGRGIRTLDIQLPKLALYQAELYPDRSLVLPARRRMLQPLVRAISTKLLRQLS